MDVRLRSSALCADLGPQSLALVESFGLTEAMLSAPIARDWVAYNEGDNQGEMRRQEEELRKHDRA